MIDDGDEVTSRLHARLNAQLRPVPARDDRRFSRWDLASTVEGAYAEILDPDAITEAEEEHWRGRLGRQNLVAREHGEFNVRYWITAEGATVGTIGVGRYIVGAHSAHVSSLYLRPAVRGAGLARQALDTVYRAALAEGMHGIRLDTNWTWQNSVRYYLARGFWVAAWKHNISFTRLRSLPRHEFRHAGDSVTLAVEHDGRLRPLLIARCNGDWLGLEETELHRELAAANTHQSTVVYGRATLAMRLAVDGWPLVRSATAWDQAPLHGDLGQPEGLAYKIRIFEDVAREDGWRVDTPTVPGLAALPAPEPTVA